MEGSDLEYIVICLVSVFVAALTLFSGFGLGTLLLPAFAFFFPIEVAVAATAVVHLANNLFKLVLVGKMASVPVTIRFTVPAVFASAAGAWLLLRIGEIPPLASYSLWGKTVAVQPIKVVIGSLIAFFSLFEIIPGFSRASVPPKYIPLGGALSGFFGGLSGMQGALRSLFLIRAGLSKEQFIGTGVVSAVVVDLSRLAVYGVALVRNQFDQLKQAGLLSLVLVGTVAAMAGTIVGSRLVKKITLETVQKIVGILLLIIAIGLITGWL